jgi:hypothetical protein
MSPRVRLLLFAIVGLAIGVYVGVDIADQQYGLAVLVGLASTWLLVGRVSEARTDSWLLAIVLVGYIVGNRGFAQLQPSATVPLLPAEATLLVAVPTLLVRMFFKKSLGVRRDFLNYAIVVWVLLGAIRLPLDMNRYGVIALRDFATVYYAAFFFIAQALGTHPASERVLTKGLTIAFVALIPVVVSILIAPDFLVDHFTWRGVPIIFHKSDLIATSLAAGFFWLWTQWTKSHRRTWLLLAAASLLLISLMQSPRAGMFAAALVTALWVAAGNWRIAAFQLGAISAAAVIALLVLSLSGGEITTSVPYSMYEHAVSIFDPAGTGTYINNESGDLGGNNQFRLIWWRDVVEDTASQSPLLGLGFGADLSTRFLADYDLLGDETFAARSPHSMLATVIGRMGFVGFAAWMSVSGGMFMLIWKLLKRGDPDGMGLASITAAVWTSACFGVVLEGPMGAVLFWTVLGLANAKAIPAAAAASPAADASVGRAVQADWPVAKAHAFDIQAGNP